LPVKVRYTCHYFWSTSFNIYVVNSITRYSFLHLNSFLSYNILRDYSLPVSASHGVHVKDASACLTILTVYFGHQAGYLDTVLSLKEFMAGEVMTPT
jgi:hypothetical protein